MQISDLVYIDSTGYHYEDYPTFLAWLLDSYRGIYGADVYLEADSLDGQFLSILAQAFYDTAALGASVYNSFSPVTAQGLGLARLVKINGLTKRVPSFSTVPITVVGTAGTVITNGVVSDTTGQKWILPVTVTIPGGGSITVEATADTAGAIFADIGTVTSIFTPTRGWQTANNATAATPGDPVEEDSELRQRQARSTANPSLTVLEGTSGAVENLTGVTKVRAYENDTDTTDADGLPEHSICLVVAGGTDTEIWEAIQIHKTPGTNTFGDTTGTVYDSKGMPLSISYQEAVAAQIGATVTLTPKTGWSTDFEDLISAAIAETINDGVIGSTVLLTKLYASAYLNGSSEGRTYDVVSIELNKNGGAFAAANVSLDFDENPVCDPSTDITYVIV